jgi:hypothetical protein
MAHQLSEELDEAENSFNAAVEDAYTDFAKALYDARTGFQTLTDVVDEFALAQGNEAERSNTYEDR